MTGAADSGLLDRLRDCAAKIEESLVHAREHHNVQQAAFPESAKVPFEAARDASGNYIVPRVYGDLAYIYIAIDQLEQRGV